jgi:RHS repeat-associated protein
MVSRFSYLGNLSLGYRFSFNGKENDADVKGDGNQYDYGFRIYDPRLVRFLSVDPLIKKYPTLTPYQFASNSPISGIDLDGREYLPFNEVRIEVVQGDVHLKMSNMHNVTRNAFEEINNNPQNWRTNEIGIDTRIGSLGFKNMPSNPIFPDVNMDNTYGANDPNFRSNRHVVSAPIAKSTGSPDRRFTNEDNRAVGGDPTSGSKGLARGSLILDGIIVGDAIARRMLGNDDFNKAERHVGILKMAVYDVNQALMAKNSPIPSEFRTPELLSDITNVVLSGVSIQGNKKVVEIGLKIYNEFSKRRLQYDGSVRITGPGGQIIMNQPIANPKYDPKYGK